MGNSNIQIQKATAEHLEAIVAIINAGATSVRKDKEFADWREYLPAFSELQEWPGTQIYVALDGEEVVGTFQVHLLKGLAFQGRPRLQVESVHVRKDRQCEGIGRIMMNFAEDHAREIGGCMIQLSSNKERQGSHHFYGRLDYDPSHVGYKKMLV